MAKLITLQICQKYFVASNFFILHAHLQYVYNILEKCCKDPVKTLSGVDFTKYALSTIIYYVQSSANNKDNG